MRWIIGYRLPSFKGCILCFWFIFERLSLTFVSVCDQIFLEPLHCSLFLFLSVIYQMCHISISSCVLINIATLPVSGHQHGHFDTLHPSHSRGRCASVTEKMSAFQCLSSFTWLVFVQVNVMNGSETNNFAWSHVALANLCLLNWFCINRLNLNAFDKTSTGCQVNCPRHL